MNSFTVEQGDVLQIEGQKFDTLVLSKDTLNKTGYAVLCPLLKDNKESTLTVPVTLNDEYIGTAHLEILRGVNLLPRHFKMRGQISYEQIQNITDAAQAMFDYYPF